MNTQLIISNTDVITLLVQDYIDKIQTEINGLEIEIDAGFNERDTLAIDFFNTVETKFNEINKEIIDAFTKAYNLLYKRKKVIITNEFTNNDHSDPYGTTKFLFNFCSWNGNDRGSLKDITSLKSDIYIYIPGVESGDEYGDEMGYRESLPAKKLKSLKLNKEMLSTWKEIQTIDNILLEKIKERNKLRNLIKDKDLVQSKAVAEMTRNALINAPEITQLIQKSFSAMNLGSKLIEVNQ